MKVTVVRVYVTEGKHVQERILNHLHGVEKVRGVTVFRGVSGFGMSGKVHSSTLLDISLDMPVVIEFFDVAEKIEEALQYLSTVVKPGHVITFSAELR